MPLNTMNTPALTSEFQAKAYQSSRRANLNYRIQIPELLNATTKIPLVLFFHGAGERGSDNTQQLKHGIKELFAYSCQSPRPAIIVAPQCPSGKRWVDTPWENDAHTMPAFPSISMRLTIELLHQLQETLPIDKSRIRVTGISMGGFATWDIIQRTPSTFSAAMPICGGGDTSMAVALKNLPIRTFHGAEDDIIKAQRSRDMVHAIQEAGGNVRYTEYPDIGHDSWGKAYSETAALKWLFESSRE